MRAGRLMGMEKAAARNDHMGGEIYRKKASQVVEAIKTRIAERAKFVAEQEPVLRERLQATGLDLPFEEIVSAMLGDSFREKMKSMDKGGRLDCLKVLTVHAVRQEIVMLTRIATHLVNESIEDDGERLITLNEGEIISYFERFDPNDVDVADAIILPRQEYGMTEALGHAVHKGLPGKLF